MCLHNENEHVNLFQRNNKVTQPEPGKHVLDFSFFNFSLNYLVAVHRPRQLQESLLAVIIIIPGTSQICQSLFHDKIQKG